MNLAPSYLQMVEIVLSWLEPHDTEPPLDSSGLDATAGIAGLPGLDSSRVSSPELSSERGEE